MGWLGAIFSVIGQILSPILAYLGFKRDATNAYLNEVKNAQSEPSDSANAQKEAQAALDTLKKEVQDGHPDGPK